MHKVCVYSLQRLIVVFIGVAHPGTCSSRQPCAMTQFIDCVVIQFIYYYLHLIKNRMENQRELRNRDGNVHRMETYCELCDTVPCFVYQFQDQVIASCEVMEITRRCDDVPPPNNNEHRKLCYKEFTRAIHGSLGQGNRV